LNESRCKRDYINATSTPKNANNPELLNRPAPFADELPAVTVLGGVLAVLAPAPIVVLVTDAYDKGSDIMSGVVNSEKGDSAGELLTEAVVAPKSCSEE